MIGLNSPLIMTAKQEHIRAIKEEVELQLSKYKNIFMFLLDFQKGNTRKFNVGKANSVMAVINLSGSKANKKTDIDDELQCIEDGYKNHAGEFYKILESIESDIDTILGADRDIMIKLIEKHDYTIRGLNNDYLKRILQKIFNYEAFSNKDRQKYNAYELTKNLRIIACPYCNRTYTLTVICKSKQNNSNAQYVTRPELDHYFPKSKYPIFALSFNNLIPSCSICNNIKGDKNDHIEMHHHPYFDYTMLDFHLNGIKYDEDNNKFNKNDEWDITLDDNECNYTNKSIEVFHLDDIYREYNFIVENMIEKAQEYNQTFIDSIELLFSEGEDHAERGEDGVVKFGNEELLERIFGVLPSEEDHWNPMNRFKRAIYKALRQAQDINISIE